MKSFVQYIAERRSTLVALQYRNNTPIDLTGIENPSSPNELMSFVLRKTSEQEARFLIHKKTKRFILWDAAQATHWEVMNGEEGSVTAYSDSEDDYVQGTIRSWGSKDIRYWNVEFTDGKGMSPSSSIISAAVKGNRVLSQMKKDAASGKIQGMQFKEDYQNERE
jgi:hypothetical protein